ncbi:MAG: glycosyltransferase family 39 protein [Pyrinomonadaceae bacterium]
MQKEAAGDSPPLNESEPTRQHRRYSGLRSRGAVAVIIFLLAIGVRVLSWHDTRLEVGKVQTAVVADYHRVAELLLNGGVRSFFSSSSPLADLNNLGHPPGYSFLIAAVYSFRHSDSAVQFMQIAGDALSAVLIFLIVAELSPVSAGAIAGLLAAFSPQLAWNSVLLLPDSISVLPILLAIYLLALGLKKPRLVNFLMVGALIGLSCWLRANGMLLTLFVAAVVPLLIGFGRLPSGGEPRKRATPHRAQTIGAQWRFAIAVICGTLLILLPLTIRNAIVFHRLIPLSLGAGQTLLEGIGDYDAAGKYGIPRTDVGIMKQEAELYQRPDYYGTLFNPDGVERERARLSRGLAIIGAHPLWFAGVMTRRASSMLRLERARLISLDPPVSHSTLIDSSTRVLIWTPDILLTNGLTLSPQATVSRDSIETIQLVGDSSKYGEQLEFGLADFKQNTDYLFVVPVRMARGRMRVSIGDFPGTALSSTVVEALENTPAETQPEKLLNLPFVTRNNQKVQIIFSNEASDPANPVASLGTFSIYELGPARFLWTRYPRFIVHAMQKVFLTAVMLPLAIIGLLVVAFRRHSTALVVLSIVPIYYFCVQSVVHTEYRYVLGVDYFLFAFAAVAIWWVSATLNNKRREVFSKLRHDRGTSATPKQV